MKMYICVLDGFPDYMTPTLVGHAVLRHHLVVQESGDGIGLLRDVEFYNDWLNNHFKKCVVRVGQKEFDKIHKLDGVVGSWENNTLGGRVSCLTVVVDNGNIPNVLKFAKLWKPKGEGND